MSPNICIGTSNGSCPWHEELNGHRHHRCHECARRQKHIDHAFRRKVRHEELMIAREIGNAPATLKEISHFLDKLAAETT